MFPDKLQLYYGSNMSPTSPIALRAGPLSISYENGAIRQVKLGHIEIIHHVYLAMRDIHWDIVPGVLGDIKVDRQSDSFIIRYCSRHQKNSIDFVWNATITGSNNGTIVFNMEGKARFPFQYNRIGFCIFPREK